MSISLEKINNIKVGKLKPLPTQIIDPRPLKGFDLFDEPYPNVFICAKKKSGKTSLLARIIQGCSTRETTVITFCSTVNKDANWAVIKHYCKKKGIAFLGFDSIKDDDGDDRLHMFLNDLKDQARASEEAKDDSDDDDDDDVDEEKMLELFGESSDEDEDSERKPRKCQFKSPKYILIVDDLSDALKHSRSVAAFVKQNRHHLAMCLLSSQYFNDITLDSRKMIDFLILYKGLSKKKLDEMYKEMNIAISHEDFLKCYAQATEVNYSFLYVDIRADSLRQNFNKRFLLPQN
jgi:hypothetical protein